MQKYTAANICSDSIWWGDALRFQFCAGLLREAACVRSPENLLERHPRSAVICLV